VNEEYLNFAKDLAKGAGVVMLKYFHAIDKGEELKGDQTPVTLDDTEINTMVIDSVKKRYPEHGVLGEEESFNLDSSQLWIVDPVDGTSNFARGLQGAVFSLAFVESGIAKVGVIYDPLIDRLFWAAAGQGAYENDRKLNVAQKNHKGRLEISSWISGAHSAAIFKHPQIEVEVLSTYIKEGNISMSDWPVAHGLALAAAGRLDASVTSCKNPWDLAAGGLIALEAGAKVTDIFGNPILRWDKDLKGIMAAPSDTHQLLMETIGPLLKGFELV
jgi:fructose-1,6-bisphosphatase/inositol monophosphatase family enzyme